MQAQTKEKKVNLSCAHVMTGLGREPQGERPKGRPKITWRRQWKLKGTRKGVGY